MHHDDGFALAGDTTILDFYPDVARLIDADPPDAAAALHDLRTAVLRYRDDAVTLLQRSPADTPADRDFVSHVVRAMRHLLLSEDAAVDKRVDPDALLAWADHADGASQRLFGPASDAAFTAAQNLARLYELRRQFPDAIRVRQRVAALSRARRGEPHATRAMVSYAETLQLAGRCVAAVDTPSMGPGTPGSRTTPAAIGTPYAWSCP